MFQQTMKRFSYIEIVEFSMVPQVVLLFKVCEMEITKAHWEFFNHRY